MQGEFCIHSNKAVPSRHHYRQFYFMPHFLLKNYVSHYTMTYSNPEEKSSPNGMSEDLTIIPDGSGCMILCCDSQGLFDICWGPTSKPVRVKRDNAAKDERMFFIEFLPGGLHAFTGIPQKELRNTQYSIDEICRDLSKALKTAVLASKSIDSLVAEADQILIQALQRKDRSNAHIAGALERIYCAGGNISIKSLAQGEYVSERHLNRLFESHIGLNGKTYIRLARVNRAANLLTKSSCIRGVDIAMESGYYDEPHLIRDFNEFCNTTPGGYIKNMSDFYNEPFKY